MKIKRYKKAERFMSLYKNNFSFREPFQVLLDGTFCQVALSHKVNIQDQLPRYLSGTCKLLTTACVIEETKRLGKPLQGAHCILSQYPVHNCGHENPVSASKCLSSLIIGSHNRDHYLVATQDHQLRQKISKHAVCPMVKLANNALVMEKPPSHVVQRIDRTHKEIAGNISHEERNKLQTLRSEGKLTDATEVDKPQKKKKFKGPNPLSVKKKKVNNMINKREATDKPANKSRRRRTRIHIAKHVKKLLQDANSSKGIETT